MLLNIHWQHFTTEIGLVLLSAGCLLADLFIGRGASRGKVLANAAMAGLTALLAVLCFTWGNFGSSFGGTFVQDGFSHFFKILLLITGIFVLYMARETETHLKRGHGEFILLILFALTGASFLVSANEFLLFFVALETLTISLPPASAGRATRRPAPTWRTRRRASRG